MKYFLSIILFFAFAHLQAQYRVSIIFEKDNTFETIEYKNIHNHEFLRKKDTDKMSSMNVKYKGVKKWDKISIKGAWGYIINEGSEKERTFRFINGKAFKIIEGTKEGNAIYHRHFQMYLILVFIWKDTFYLSYDDQLIELKSKKYLKQTLIPGTCLGKAVEERDKSIFWLLTRKKKLGGKSRLMSMIEACDKTSLIEKQ